MKELSIEEKAQAYDEAIAYAKKLLKTIGNATLGNLVLKNEFKNMFPALEESEDEKIRKNCIHFLELQKSHHASTVEIEECIAWLEKQGEHFIYNVPSKEIILAIWDLGNEWKELTNGSISTEYGTQLDYIQKHWEESEYYLREKQREQKLANKVEPKFHEGEWITNGDYTWKILEATPLDYILQSQDGNIVDDTLSHVDKQFHLWSIQDAKDGDVLATPNKNIFIFKDIKGTAIYDYCGLYFGEFKSVSSCVNGKISVELPDGYLPATKEQRDLLFQKMKEARYEWDAEKKELKKIENEMEIPFGAKDSELQEATYYIPKGFYAEIDSEKVVIKKS